MAAFGARMVNFASEENQVLKGKNKPPQAKRAVLKEVGNKNLPQLQGKGTAQVFQKLPEKKPLPLPAVKFPIAKQPSNKEPSIQVKYTKACRLRTQHSRQSIGRVTEKKSAFISDSGIKDESVSKQEIGFKVSQSMCGAENVQQHRLQAVKSHNDIPAKDSKSEICTVKTECSTSDNNCKGDLTKTNVNSRHDAPSAFSSTLLNCTYVIDIDKDDENDPIMLGMYAKDMYKYLREMEVKFPITPRYLKNSKLTGKMRATLIDWLVEVQREFELNPETLFLTVAIIDRFLQKNPSTNRNHLQLVGISAMFIASKYEEMILPDISELVYVSDNAYSKQEILQMEVTMVKSLDCSFGRPLPIHFLRRYSKADRVAPLIHVMAKYIMETGVAEYDLCHIAPSLLAAAALYISLWLLKSKKDVWSNNLIQYSSYSLQEILPVAKNLSSVLSNAATSKLQAIRKKYAHPKNLQVSVLPVLKNLPELNEQL